MEKKGGKITQIGPLIYCTLQMLRRSRSSPFMPQNVLDSQQQHTGDFQFSFHYTSPVQKNSKGHILTLVSDIHYFNCLSYEMEQHKLK